ncbi:hypothetical protein [Lysinibacillus sp. 54212]|uniref:hypothetical protein n=1 Tax=Lysinibacillus sp. 54212 TaxID=3119829 RepID=UPI002FC8909F
MNINGKDRHVQKLYKAQKLTLYWLLGLIYSGFIGFQLGRIQAIADFNYNLHELMFVPATIALFVVPVLFLIYLYFLIKYLLGRGKQKMSLKTSTLAGLVVVSIIGIVFITGYQSLEVSTSGIFEVDQKLQEERKYYLVFDDQRVSVSYNEFQLVEENQQYLISFVWNKRTPNEGRLETIEPLR